MSGDELARAVFQEMVSPGKEGSTMSTRVADFAEAYRAAGLRELAEEIKSRKVSNPDLIWAIPDTEVDAALARLLEDRPTGNRITRRHMDEQEIRKIINPDYEPVSDATIARLAQYADSKAREARLEVVRRMRAAAVRTASTPSGMDWNTGLPNLIQELDAIVRENRPEGQG
jgi:hypothetical protein